MTTSKTAKRRLRRLDGEMAKYSEEWSLAKIVAANAAFSTARWPLTLPTSSVAVAALRMMQEEADRRGSSVGFRRVPGSPATTPPPFAA